VGWETRERGVTSYYYRSVREGERVKKEYVGGGLLGQVAAKLDEIERLRKKEEVASWEVEREHIERSAAFLHELTEAAEVLVRAHLLASGCHHHKASGGGNVDLELPKDVKDRLVELRTLSQRVEDGDKEARRELRKVVRESTPEVISRASDIGRCGQWALIKTVAANDPLTEEALMARLDLMRAEVAGADPSPLEILLTERICSLWLLIEALEMLVSVQLSGELPREHRSPMSYLQHVFKWQESANRRFLSAIRELARVRKLQSNVPGIQYNAQINLPTANHQREEEPNC